jgi:predicted RecA/RadA family phage recombinase
MKNYVNEGKTIEFTASGRDYAAGDVVVIGTLLACAVVDVADGETGVASFGVFDLPKVDAAVITKGQTLTFDISAADGVGEFDDDQATAAAGDITGAAAVAYESKNATSGETIRVKLTGVPGVVETGS